jgi:hypothetical protein
MTYATAHEQEDDRLGFRRTWQAGVLHQPAIVRPKGTQRGPQESGGRLKEKPAALNPAAWINVPKVAHDHLT